MQLLLLSSLFFTPPPSTPTYFASLFFFPYQTHPSPVPSGGKIRNMFVSFSLTCTKLPQKIQDESVCDIKYLGICAVASSQSIMVHGECKDNKFKPLNMTYVYKYIYIYMLLQ